MFSAACTPSCLHSSTVWGFCQPNPPSLAGVDIHSPNANLAVNITAPMKLAVTPFTNRCLLRVVTSTTAHQVAAVHPLWRPVARSTMSACQHGPEKYQQRNFIFCISESTFGSLPLLCGNKFIGPFRTSLFALLMYSNKAALICCARKMYKPTQAYCTAVTDTMNPDRGLQRFTSPAYTTSLPVPLCQHN
jgi:hypothetical protein